MLAIKGKAWLMLGVLGYSLNKSKGTNPDLTKLGMKGNWRKYFASNKLIADVIIKLHHEVSVTLSVDKTTVTADNSDAVTI